jgi:hypothetical protein
MLVSWRTQVTTCFQICGVRGMKLTQPILYGGWSPDFWAGWQAILLSSSGLTSANTFSVKLPKKNEACHIGQHWAATAYVSD